MRADWISLLSPFECLCGNFILPEPASYVFSYAIFNLRKLLYIIYGVGHAAGVCRVFCCDQDGGDRQAAVLPCHGQDLCRGVPQLQLGIYLPQAARAQRGRKVNSEAETACAARKSPEPGYQSRLRAF